MKKIVDLLLENIHRFKPFSEVYVFGSILNSKNPNDIDLLLIYKIYSENIEKEKNSISLILEQLINLPVDLTVLSEKELKQTDFLNQLNNNYKKLKG